MSVLALDLGGTKLAVAVFSPRGEILSRNSIPLNNRKGLQVGELIVGEVEKYIEIEGNTLKAIGVSVPGISRQKSGSVWAPNIPGWEDYPLVKEIKEVAGQASVHMDSDRACCILGEQWQGNAKGCQDAIFMAVGTGIGAGILIDGNILRGANDIAGAVGWLALKPPFEKKYIPCGCYEYYASGDGIARYAHELLASDNSYDGPLRLVAETLVAQHVFDAWEQRDPIATKVLHEAIQLWGMAVANFISIFNPSKVIFGGGVFGPAVKFIPDIKAEAGKWAQPISFKRVSFEKSGLGGNAAIYGAGFLALKNSNS